ncbi:MAG: hypothetical protein K1X57_04725 [Gemmataceae bacterium]|nr:hypothetical protein [Gemmataceae bacterium]
MRNQRSSLALLRLEDRLTPAASIQLTGGNLLVRGDNTPNLLELTANGNVVTVRANDIVLGTYAVTGNISVFGGNSPDQIFIRVNGVFPGDVSINTGNGNDVVDFDGGNGAGTVNGRMSILLGAGDDEVRLGGRAGLNVGGPLFVDGGAGFDTFGGQGVPQRTAGNPKIANRPDGNVLFGFVKISGNTTMNGVNGFGSNGDAPGDSSFGGPFVLSWANEGTDGYFLPNNTTFNGDVVVSAGPGNDQLTPIFGNEFKGNTTFLAGAGNNSSEPYGENYFRGAFTYIGGNGADTLLLGEPHGGNVNLFLGDGNNQAATLLGAPRGTGLPAGNLVIAGDLIVRGGNGTDGFNLFQATVSGNVNVDLGNGDNSANFQSIISGSVRYTGGGGIDTVEVGGANSFALTVNLGAGADVFRFTAGTTVGSASIDFGAGADSYFDNGVVVFWNYRLLNL